MTLVMATVVMMTVVTMMEMMMLALPVSYHRYQEQFSHHSTTVVCSINLDTAAASAADVSMSVNCFS